MDKTELRELIEKCGGLTRFCRKVSEHEHGDYIHPQRVHQWLRSENIPKGPRAMLTQVFHPDTEEPAHVVEPDAVDDPAD